MNVLITGGAGYIGSVVAAELVKTGNQVIVYDNLSHGHRAAVPVEAEFLEGSIGDRQKLEELFSRQRIDAVMHFAALIETGESMHCPERYFRNNSADTLVLLESMLAKGINQFVFSSTAAVYGNPQRTPILEEDPLLPTNAYGQSKVLVEQILVWLNRIHGFRYASLRYFNVAGSSGHRGEAHEPETHLIPLLLQVASGKRESISILGTDYPTPDGTCIRDYVHIADLASAHLLALQGLEKQDKLIYNLGNGNGFTVREVIEVARKVTGRPIPAVESARRPGDPAVLVASAKKIKEELGWQPKYKDLHLIVGSAWEWHQTHPEGYTAAEKAG